MLNFRRLLSPVEIHVWPPRVNSGTKVAGRQTPAVRCQAPRLSPQVVGTVQGGKAASYATQAFYPISHYWKG